MLRSESGNAVGVVTRTSSQTGSDVVLGRFDLDGFSLAQTLTLNTVNERNSRHGRCSEFFDGNAVCVFQSEGSVYARLLKEIEGKLSISQDPILIHRESTNPQSVPSVEILGSGSVLVSWHQEGQLKGRILGINEGMLKFDQPVNTLFEEAHFVHDVSDLCLDPPSHSSILSVGCDGFIAAATSSRDSSLGGEGSDIYIRYFEVSDGNLSAKSDSVQVNLHHQSNQEYPEIVSFDGGFFGVIYKSHLQDGDGNGVFINIFSIKDDGSIEMLSQDFRISERVEGDQEFQSSVLLRMGVILTAYLDKGPGVQILLHAISNLPNSSSIECVVPGSDSSSTDLLFLIFLISLVLFPLCGFIYYRACNRGRVEVVLNNGDDLRQDQDPVILAPNPLYQPGPAAGGGYDVADAPEAPEADYEQVD